MDEDKNIPILTPESLRTASAITVEEPEVLPAPSLAGLPKPEVPQAPKAEGLEDIEKEIIDLETFDLAGKVTEGTADARRELNEINKRIRLHEAAALEASEKALESGETLGFARGEAAIVRREAAVEALRLSAIAQAKQGELSLATDIAERAANAEFAQKKRDILTARNTILNNFETFSKAEKKRAEAILTQLDSQDLFVKEQQEKRRAIDAVALEKARRGADIRVLDKIRAAGDAVEAERIAVEEGFGEEEEEKASEFQFVAATKTQAGGIFDKKKGVFTPFKALGPVSDSGAAAGVPNAEFGTPEYAYNQIVASSQFDDKRLTDSRLEKLDQAALALGGVESLNALLFQGKDGINLTGPVKGKVRGLLTKLGGDAPAAAINATIQGLIPTVARGIFGEVGVLTDADINNYKKTIANLTSSEDQNRLVSVIMLDVLSRSYENVLLNSARNQTNVSGFSETYLNIMERVKSEKLKLGTTSFSQLDNDELLDSVPEGETSSVVDDDFSFGDLFNSFIGIFK